MANVTVKAAGFALALFLLSLASNREVLINTNGWYGCEEPKSRRYGRITDATKTLRAVCVAVDGCVNGLLGVKKTHYSSQPSKISCISKNERDLKKLT